MAVSPVQVPLSMLILKVGSLSAAVFGGQPDISSVIRTDGKEVRYIRVLRERRVYL